MVENDDARTEDDPRRAPTKTGGQSPSNGRHRKRRSKAARGAEQNATSGKRPTGARPVGGKRHQGRVLALQVLYEIDVTGHALEETLARTFEEQPAPPPVREHVEQLVRGVLLRRDEIDPMIAEAAPAFPVAQIPAIDRNVLRLAIYELLHEPRVPAKAAINEAVELAKRFGGDNSGRFVNGVLGTVAERIGDRPADPVVVGNGAQPPDVTDGEARDSPP